MIARSFDFFFIESEAAASAAPPAVQTVDDFVPDEGLDKSFLDDSLPSNTRHAMNNQPSTTGITDSDRQDHLHSFFFFNLYLMILLLFTLCTSLF